MACIAREPSGKHRALVRTAGIYTSQAVALLLLALPSHASAQGARTYATVGATAKSPIGWVEFCEDNPKECPPYPEPARNVAITQQKWKDLIKINRSVNEQIKPLTDMEHWAVLEKWSYPLDGYGDCEDYALLKRKKLIDAGWPPSALLMTISAKTLGRRPGCPHCENGQRRIFSG